MKKTISFILALCLMMAMSVLAVGCNKEPEHNHSAQTTWQTDATHHWHVCSGDDCEEQLGKTEHNFGTELRRNDTHHYLMCECGAKSNEQAHVYDHALDTSCNVCGPTRNLPTIYELTLDTEGYYVSIDIEGIDGGEYVFKLPANRISDSWEFYLNRASEPNGTGTLSGAEYTIKIFNEEFIEIEIIQNGCDLFAKYDSSDYKCVYETYTGEDLYIMVTLNEAVDFHVWMQ